MRLFVLFVFLAFALPSQATEYQNNLFKNTHTHDKSEQGKSRSHAYYAILMIDLGNDGFQLSAKDEGAFFNYFKNQDFKRTQWVAKDTNDAFIMMDYNFNQVVDNAFDLIGEGDIRYGPKFLKEGYAKHGYQDLAQYDDPRRGGNGDKVINKDDEIWSIFKMWVDSDANGVSSKHELMTLDEAGLTEIGFTQFTENKKMDDAGNILSKWSKAKGREDKTYPVVSVRFHLIDLHEVNNRNGSE